MTSFVLHGCTLLLLGVTCWLVSAVDQHMLLGERSETSNVAIVNPKFDIPADIPAESASSFNYVSDRSMITRWSFSGDETTP